MKTLKSVGIGSVAKLHGTLMAIMFGLTGAFMTVIGFFWMLLGAGWEPFGLGLAVLILGAIFGLVVGYIQGAIGSWIYNMVAGKVGGIEMELE